MAKYTKTPRLTHKDVLDGALRHGESFLAERENTLRVERNRRYRLANRRLTAGQAKLADMIRLGRIVVARKVPIIVRILFEKLARDQRRTKTRQ